MNVRYTWPQLDWPAYTPSCKCGGVLGAGPFFWCWAGATQNALRNLREDKVLYVVPSLYTYSQTVVGANSLWHHDARNVTRMVNTPYLGDLINAFLCLWEVTGQCENERRDTSGAFGRHLHVIEGIRSAMEHHPPFRNTDEARNHAGDAATHDSVEWPSGA